MATDNAYEGGCSCGELRYRINANPLIVHAYRLFWHRPPLYNPDNFFANGDNEFGELLSQNMFCLPRESAFEVSGLVEITSPEAGQGGS